MRFDRLWRLTVFGLVACGAISTGAQAPNDVDARARAIHRRVLVIDSHTDVLLPGSPENLYAPGHTSHTDLDKLKRGGVGCLAMAGAYSPRLWPLGVLAGLLAAILLAKGHYV